MATSGSVSTSKYDGRYGILEWTCTQSGTVTTVNWTCSLKGGSSGWYITSQCYFDVTCSSGTANVERVTVLPYNTSREGRVGQIGSGSFTITHNSSGAAKFTIALSLATYTWEVNCTGSSTWSLPSRFTLTLTKGTGISSVSGGGTYTDGVSVTVTATPSTGYNFKQWTKGSSAASTSASYTFTITANTALTAVGVLKTYAVTYSANGGSGAPSSQTKTYGTTLTLSSTKPTRAGYTFSSWNTKSDGSGATYAPGASYTTNAKLDLYAQWTIHKLTVIYNANGGTQSSGSDYTLPHTTTVNYGSNYNGTNGLYDFSTFKLTKTGYSATYWNTKADGSGVSIDCTTSYTSQGLATACGLNLSTGNRTINFYPKWVANSYTVQYNGNGHTGGSTANTSHVYGTASALAANGFTKTNHTFDSWNTKADGTGTKYAAGASVSTLAASGTVTLYAQWKAWTYTIKYFPNGGEGTAFTSSHSYGVSSRLSANTFTRQNYTFLGWSTSSTGAVIYEDADYAPQDISSDGAQISLYAIWSQNSPWTLSMVYIHTGGSWHMF